MASVCGSALLAPSPFARRIPESSKVKDASSFPQSTSISSVRSDFVYQSGILSSFSLPHLSYARSYSAKKIITNASAASSQQVPSRQLLVYVPPHPLVKHWVAVLRNESTPPPMFKAALAELGRILIYECLRDWLPTVEGQVQTPCGIADVEFVDPRLPINVVPILRAGLVLIEHIGTVVPSSKIYHVGYERNEETLQPSLYLNKLPESFPPDSRVLIVDPMLATGGTITAAIDEVIKRSVDLSSIRVVSAIAATPALNEMNKKYPGLKVYTGIIDPELNDKGYIVPGLGDAGDRCFNTL